MKLFVYLLALMTGLTAGQPALSAANQGGSDKPVQVASNDSEARSEIALGSIVSAHALAPQKAVVSDGQALVAAEHIAGFVAPRSTPQTRADIAHE